MYLKFRTSTVLVVLTVFSLILGACASATVSPTATAAPTSAPTALPATGPTSAPAAGPVIMVAQNAALGAILTDSKGMTLYVYTKDTPGASTCTGDCAGIWPPLTVPAGTTPTAGSGFSGMLGTIQRSDGTTQVTVNNQPVYLWVKDKKPGDTTGQNIGKVWFVLDVSGKIVNTVPAAAPTKAPAASSQGPMILVADTANMGSIITDSKGMTLYIYTKDTPGASTCTGQCATFWPPLLVPAGATPTADSKFTGKLGTIQRADGTTQVTVNNQPVYYFAKDKNAGDAAGQKVGNVWFVIDATGAMMNK
jgi:predicted lipoprotein with Yx(FWY)xxD motif